MPYKLWQFDFYTSPVYRNSLLSQIQFCIHSFVSGYIWCQFSCCLWEFLLQNAMTWHDIPSTVFVEQWCYYAPPRGALSDDAVWHLSVWRLSIAYIRPKSRTERPRKAKIGSEVAHVTLDSDTTFKVRRSKVKVACEVGAYCGGLPPTACLVCESVG